MCDGTVKIQPGYGVFNCQCGFKRSVEYPTMRGNFKTKGTKAEWIQDRLMSIVATHMDHMRGSN